MQQFDNVKSTYNEIFLQDIDARFDNDGTEWIVHRGAPPSISTLLQSLSDVKANSRVTLHLQGVAHDYFSEDKFKDTAKKYPQSIQFAIYVNVVKVENEVDAEAEKHDDDKGDEEEEKKDKVETKDDEEKEAEEEGEEEEEAKPKAEEEGQSQMKIDQRR